MRTIIASCSILVLSLGVLMAEEFGAVITKIETKDGKTTITGKKGKKDEAKEFTLTVAKDVKVNKGKFDKVDKKVVAGDPLEDGLKNEYFKDVSGKDPTGSVGVTLITAEKDKEVFVIQILTKGKKKGT